jgi:hypothetical protein
MKLLLSCVVALALVGSVRPACSERGVAAAQAPTVDELVAQNVAARGGMDRIKALETLKITRTVATGIGNNVRVIIYKKRPQLYRGEQGPAQPGAPMVPRGVNADDAWDTVQGKITTRPEAAEAESREIDADFDGLLIDWKQKGSTLVYDGTERLPAGDSYKLKVTTRSGVVRTVYLDAKTGLEIRHTGAMTLPNGRKLDVVIDFANWKDVNGVKFPFDINEDRVDPKGQTPAQSLVIYTEKVEANVPMEDALFATPKM